MNSLANLLRIDPNDINWIEKMHNYFIDLRTDIPDVTTLLSNISYNEDVAKNIIVTLMYELAINFKVCLECFLHDEEQSGNITKSDRDRMLEKADKLFINNSYDFDKHIYEFGIIYSSEKVIDNEQMEAFVKAPESFLKDFMNKYLVDNGKSPQRVNLRASALLKCNFLDIEVEIPGNVDINDKDALTKFLNSYVENYAEDKKLILNAPNVVSKENIFIEYSKI